MICLASDAGSGQGDWELPSISLRNPRPSNAGSVGMEPIGSIPHPKPHARLPTVSPLPAVQPSYVRNARYRPGLQPLMAKGNSLQAAGSSGDLPPLARNTSKNRGVFNPVAFNLEAAGFGKQGHSGLIRPGHYGFPRR